MPVDAPSQLAQETLVVTGTPATLTMPLRLSATLQPQRDNDRVLLRHRPRHLLMRNIGTQPVRWRSDGVAASGVNGQLLKAGEELSFMDQADYFGIIKGMSLVRDVDATADGTLELAYF